MTLRQEGRIERQAIVGLTSASTQGRCGNHVSAAPVAVLRAVNALLAAGGLGPATSANPSIAPSPGRQPSSAASRGSAGRARSKVNQQPPASSASIAPPQAGGRGFLLLGLALAIALGVGAVWWLVSGRSTQPAGAAGTPRLGPARVPDVKGALDARRLGRGAAALAGAVGLAALLDVVAARRRRAFAPRRPADAAPRSETSPTPAPTAEPGFRRADERGDAAGAFQDGVLMEKRNDLFGAEAAFRRADDRGHPAGASKLGMLLEHRGDLPGAEAAYRRADGRGDATGAFKLAAILEDRNDLDGAEAAYRRACERGGGYVTDLAEAALSLLRARR